MMEEEMQPCVECNQIGREKCEVPPLDLAAGDQRICYTYTFVTFLSTINRQKSYSTRSTRLITYPTNVLLITNED